MASAEAKDQSWPAGVQDGLALRPPEIKPGGTTDATTALGPPMGSIGNVQPMISGPTLSRADSHAPPTPVVQRHEPAAHPTPAASSADAAAAAAAAAAQSKAQDVAEVKKVVDAVVAKGSVTPGVLPVKTTVVGPSGMPKKTGDLEQTAVQLAKMHKYGGKCVVATCKKGSTCNRPIISCPGCPKKFHPHRDNFNTHLNTHGLGFRFQCQECDKSFSSRSNLKVHKKSKKHLLRVSAAKVDVKVF